MIIKNKLNSPFELVDKDGKKVMLPAGGEVTIEPHPMHLSHYRQVGYFEILDVESPAETEAQEPDPIEALRNDYEELAGKSADKRWSESRLQSEIEELMEQDDV